MASKIKKSINNTKTITVEAILNLDNLTGFKIKGEEFKDGEMDISSILKDFNGQYVNFSFKVKDNIELQPDEPFEE